jgi:hypothetical protein
MANQPFLPLYTGDWKKDPQLSLCAPATRGIWIDLLCSLHDARVSQLSGEPAQLARLCRCDSGSMHTALLELRSTGAATINEREGVFTVTCRRMKKAEELSKTRSVAGSKGAGKTEAKPEYESEDEGRLKVVEYGRELGIPDSDSEWFFFKCHGNGWTNGGKPILRWKATIRSWKSAGYLPSQKNGTHVNGSAPKRQMSAFEIEKRIEAINGTLNKLYREAGIARGGKYTADQQREVDELKAAKNDLKRQLARA